MTRRLPPMMLLTAGLVLAGCSQGPSPADSGTSAAPASASAGATAAPSPTSTLSAEQQQAVDEAAAVVLAYRQMFYDVLTDPEPYLNDINSVTAQPQLKIDLVALQRLLSDGETEINSTGPVTIASVDPLRVDLGSDPPTITLLVCVDASAVAGVQEGQPFTGTRQEMQYRVVRTSYLPAPGWAVAEVLAPTGSQGSRSC